jgi:haloalkane dehalogenase
VAAVERLPPLDLPDWLERLAPRGRSRVRLRNYRLGLVEAGEGPLVLLLHGNPTWSFLWRRVMAELAGDGLRLCAPDLLGLGCSDKPGDPRVHTLEHHAHLIGELLDGLGGERVVLVGQDWGGPVGLRAFSERPDRLAGLVLANTVVGPPRSGFRATWFHRLARLPLASDLLFRGLGFPQNALPLVQGDRASIRGEVARAYRWPLRRLRDRMAPLALARMVPDSLSHPTVPALAACESLVKRFGGPIALVWGERDPILGRVLHHLERMLPQASVRRTSAGHFLQEEVPVELAQAIREVVGRARF